MNYLEISLKLSQLLELNIRTKNPIIIMRLIALIITLACFIPLTSQAQSCRKFAKKECIPTLTPYIHNGQLNSAMLFPGDKADMMLTFYSGQNYKLIVCNDEQLGDVTYRVLDLDRNELFNSKDKGTKEFAFKVASTQQLIVEVNVPEGNSTIEMDFKGCVSILIGFKG